MMEGASQPQPQDGALPLRGIVVADFSRVLAGPFATMLLADMGADVVKVERPEGDETRAWGPPFVAAGSTYFLSVNRNKRSLVLDLKDPGDLELALQLAAEADVLIENFRPGTMERLGLSGERLERLNPGLVRCGLSGFGRTEAAASLPGYDLLVQALGGLMSMTGPEGGEPTKVGVALVDVLAGLFATVGILAALRERERSGCGQRVDVSLLGALLSSLVNQASGYVLAGEVPRPLGNRHPSIAPYQTYAAADGPVVIAVGNDRQFAALCEVVGEPGLAADPRFAANAERVAHREELAGLLEQRLCARPGAEWVERFTAAGVPSGKVNDLREAFAFAESIGLDPTRSIAGDPAGPVATVANPIDFSRSPVDYRLPPPRLDAHGPELRTWLEQRLRERTQARG